MPPGRLVDLSTIEPPGISPALLARSVDVGGVVSELRDVVGLAQVHDMGGRADLMRGAQPLGKRFQRLAVRAASMTSQPSSAKASAAPRNALRRRQ
jgi:hypothetical protein